jgi:hypothetical protein
MATSKQSDDTWTYACPGYPADPCGGNDLPSFQSSGWPTKKIAEARGAQHIAEHEDPTNQSPMPELHVFRQEHGLAPTEDGLRAVQKGSDA